MDDIVQACKVHGELSKQECVNQHIGKYFYYRCKKCAYERHKKYRVNNSEKLVRMAKRWRSKNPEKAKGYAKKYNAKHSEKLRRWREQYRIKNLDKVKAISNKSHKKYRDRAPLAYIKGILRTNGDRSIVNNLPVSFLEAKRSILLIKRLIKQRGET